MNIGDEISAKRRERGISQEELAAALGVTRQTISKWETGQMPVNEAKRDEIDAYFSGKPLLKTSLSAENEAEAPVAPAHKRVTVTQKITVVGVAILLVALIFADIIIGCLSVPNLSLDENAATTIYVDIGYFWLSLAVTVLVAAFEAFTVFTIIKQTFNRDKK